MDAGVSSCAILTVDKLVQTGSNVQQTDILNLQSEDTTVPNQQQSKLNGKRKAEEDSVKVFKAGVPLFRER